MIKEFAILFFSVSTVSAQIEYFPAVAHTSLLRGEGKFQTRSAERSVFVDGRFYKINYEYQPQYAMVPLTSPPGQPHYTAVIQVYVLKENGFTKVGESFGGYYTDAGCFEDDPTTLVNQAIEAQSKNQGVEPKNKKTIEDEHRSATMQKDAEN